MDAERARTFLLSLPHVVETHQWDSAVFWMGDKAIGGRMFVMLELDPALPKVLSYPAGPERYHERLELDGIFPAPYMARAFWVSVKLWSVYRNAEWEEEFRAAHTLTYEKLAPKVKAILALPKAQQKPLITAARTKAAAKSAAKASSKPPRRSHMSLDG